MSARDAPPPPPLPHATPATCGSDCFTVSQLVGHLSRVVEEHQTGSSEARGGSRKKPRAASPDQQTCFTHPPLQMLRRVKVSQGRLELEDSRCATHRTTVFVWDLDETLVVFNSLWNGSYAKLYEGSKDAVQGTRLGHCWEKLILSVCDKFFFFEEVEDFCEPNISSLIEYDDGADLSGYDFRGDEFKLPSDAVSNRKLAYRHRFISQLYSQGLESLLSEEQIADWNRLYEATDKYTDGWLSAGRRLLAECRKVSTPSQGEANSQDDDVSADKDEARLGEGSDVQEGTRSPPGDSGSVNVLVTSGVLIPSIVKCLLFKLNDFIDCDKIYSSRLVDKLTCFRAIKERFSHLGNRFCVIGDGREECRAAERLAWPFVKMEAGPDGVNRLPTLTIDTVKLYMRVVYDDPIYDDEELALFAEDDKSDLA